MRQSQDRELESLDQSIKAERKEEHGRRSALDRDGVRSKQKELVDYASDCEPRLGHVDEHGRKTADPKLKGRLKLYLAALALGFSALEAAIDAYNRAVSRQQRYSPDARDAARQVHVCLSKIRTRAEKRLGNSEQARAVKHACAVGGLLNADAVMDMRDRAVTVLAALQTQDYAELFAAREFDAALFVRELTPALTRLKAEIGRGVGHETKKGEGSEDINDALLYLEITFARLVAFLEDHGCAEEAAILNARIPRRHQRRAEDKGGSGGGGTSGGGTP